MDFGWTGPDEHPAYTIRVPVGQGQVIDGDLPDTNLLERQPAIRTARLAAPVATHRDLHTDLLDEKFLHDAPGEPKQLLEIE